MSEKVTTDAIPVDGDGSASGEPTATEYNSDFVEKLKKEKENFRTVAQQKEAELEKFKADQKLREEKDLAEKNDFKKLYELKAKELEDVNGRLAESRNKELDSKKESVLKAELAKLGVDPSYADKATKLGNLSQIKIDTETGVIYGADMVAKGLSDDWPALFGTASEKVAQHAPESPTPTGALTLEAWQKLPYEERKKREGEIYLNAKN